LKNSKIQKHILEELKFETFEANFVKLHTDSFSCTEKHQKEPTFRSGMSVFFVQTKFVHLSIYIHPKGQCCLVKGLPNHGQKYLEDVRKACFKFCKPNIILSVAFLAPKDDFF
jgi:hypothetical protein